MKHKISVPGELGLEYAMDLSQYRLRNNGDGYCFTMYSLRISFKNNPKLVCHYS
jgi:hypothetical protein